ncbi:hypothetical protein [Halomarina rubra]|uniref:DUF3311 domain-containing protein n=1 Tax=Halomarina rubra TaxID=2071873 RepID=A0ABD6B3S0_9EURY|nr:hypothetical protein [Halomarina rubra]
MTESETERTYRQFFRETPMTALLVTIAPFALWFSMEQLPNDPAPPVAVWMFLCGLLFIPALYGIAAFVYLVVKPDQWADRVGGD